MIDDNFRKSLKVVSESDIDSSGSLLPIEDILDEEEFVKQSTQNYVTLYNIPEVREYYTQVVTAILLAYNEKYGNNGLQLNYRFKAPNSIANKMREYVRDKHSPNSALRPSQPMYDGFAMKLITSEVPSLLYSRDQKKYFDSDKTLSTLVKERKENYKFLEKMQEFRSRLVLDEFEIPTKYNLSISQDEYFSNCISVLQRTKNMIDPDETNLLDSYDEKIRTMKEKLSISRDVGTLYSPISLRELENPSTNFLLFMEDYESRMHNELAMAVLTRQFTSLFNNNSRFFDSLGIKLAPHSIKEPKRKRTENGYESNFIYIDTMFGTIECQLQTHQQYVQGKTGSAAHLLYKNSDDSRNSLPRPIPIPSRSDMINTTVAENFFNKILEISPRMYSVTLGRERTKDIEFGAFRNYYSIFSEIPPTHPLAPQFQHYFSELRDRPDSPLNDFPDILRQYNAQDLEDYISGKEFPYVGEISRLWYSQTDDFADAYSSIVGNRRGPIHLGSIDSAVQQMRIDFDDLDDNGIR